MKTTKPASKPTTQLEQAIFYFGMLLGAPISSEGFEDGIKGMENVLLRAQNRPPQGQADGTIEINTWNVLTRFVRNCKAVLSDSHMVDMLLIDTEDTEPNIPRNNPGSIQKIQASSTYGQSHGKDIPSKYLPEEPPTSRKGG